MEDLLDVVRSSERTEILKLLADEPKCVSAIADALFLRISTVSEHLAHLEARGLVTCTRVKTFHFYHLTDRVRAIRNGEMLQLVLVLDEYRWVLLHLDETIEPHKPVPPPTVFVDRR